MNYGTRLPSLANGAPAQRLHHLAQHLHDLGPRSVHAVSEEVLKGADDLSVLERFATHDPRVMRAIGGYGPRTREGRP